MFLDKGRFVDNTLSTKERALDAAVKRITGRKSLSDEAAALIRHEILTGGLKPGQRLIESHLASELGISRAPVREALRLLRAEGLVSDELNRGSFVVSLSTDEVAQMYDLRAALESRAARLVTRARRTADVDALRLLVERIQRAGAQENAGALYEADLVFHQTLIGRARNRYLEEAFNRTMPALRILINLDKAAYQTLDILGQEHRSLVEAIERGDEEVAARWTREHVELGARHVIDHLHAAQVDTSEAIRR